mmetsp:Transcript_16962/g.41667  ORF Transcript_16962/g.41667 Transcript_16962/m.41667 type:complete len:222 (+) Transcript_16962:202-867(+)
MRRQGPGDPSTIPPRSKRASTGTMKPGCWSCQNCDINVRGVTVLAPGHQARTAVFTHIYKMTLLTCVPRDTCLTSMAHPWTPGPGTRTPFPSTPEHGLADVVERLVGPARVPPSSWDPCTLCTAAHRHRNHRRGRWCEWRGARVLDMQLCVLTFPAAPRRWKMPPRLRHRTRSLGGNLALLEGAEVQGPLQGHDPPAARVVRAPRRWLVARRLRAEGSVAV